jgi:hypothetical protein
MSTPPDLNSVSRFRKQPGKLVLEEHSHCEVPAGCGGVVLRWRNPLAAVPLTLRIYTPAPVVCFIDGAEVQSARVDLAPGRRVFGFFLKEAELSAGLILFVATRQQTLTNRIPPSTVTELPLHVLTADDGTWKCTVNEPANDDWKMAAFNDDNWLALTRSVTPQLESGIPGAYQCRECIREGAICLGLPSRGQGEEQASWWQRLLGRQPQPSPPSAKSSVWIRRVFDIPLPEVREP